MKEGFSSLFSRQLINHSIISLPASVSRGFLACNRDDPTVRYFSDAGREVGLMSTVSNHHSSKKFKHNGLNGPEQQCC